MITKHLKDLVSACVFRALYGWELRFCRFMARQWELRAAGHRASLRREGDDRDYHFEQARKCAARARYWQDCYRERER